jgi:hypothetical protein
MSHGTHCVRRLGVIEQPKSAPCPAMASRQRAVRLSFWHAELGQPVGHGAMPTALLDDVHDLCDGSRSFGKLGRVDSMSFGWRLS